MNPLRSTSHREVQLRAVDGGDNDRLYRLFAASRDDLLVAISDWEEAPREAFMRLQFQTLQDQYRRQYPRLQWDLLIRRGDAIGQLLIAPIDAELRLVDINLLPACRNRGIGKHLLQDLLNRAAAENRCVSLHVLQDNPAARLYERLGFTHAGEQGIYRRMEWKSVCGATSETNTQRRNTLS